ncbi:MAG TPA: PilC/PilY family type IV pilus protein [Steroidobacteraceae bacterium]|nr:PilC/PilY family type IV pilus protein [Steroidobacteraceae bacterium]
MVSPARYFTKAASVMCGVLLASVSAPPAHSEIPLAETPLFLEVSVPPNITLTLDDSGSMSRAWVPEDNCPNSSSDINGCTAQANRYEKSASRNLIMYNPNVKYPVPKDADGNPLSTSFTAAYVDGFDTSRGTVNLATSYRPTASIHVRNGEFDEVFMPHYFDGKNDGTSVGDFRCDTSANRCEYRKNGTWIDTATSCPGTRTSDRNNICTGTFSSTTGGNGVVPAGMPAYYYNLDKTISGCNTASAVTNNACYRIVFVSSTSGPGTIDLDGNGRTGDAADKDERQNFANWYSFARTRNLATMTGAALAFADLSESARVAWQALNSCRNSTDSLPTSQCKGWKGTPAVSNAIKPFADSHRSDFYKWLGQLPTNGGTPLPQAMQRVGAYYSTRGENSPYDNDFSSTNSGEYSCRRNYHIMMTDGIWNNRISTLNRDGLSTSLPEAMPDVVPQNKQYDPIAPYKDSTADTLADVAFKYWITDLRTDLRNNLLPRWVERSGGDTPKVEDRISDYWNAKNDPAQWQHMVNFTIGLGLSGFLSQTTPVLTYDPANPTYGGSYPQLSAGTLQWPAASSSGTPANVADLWHAALNSRGLFFSADNPAALSDAFQQVITQISATSGSASSLSANSTSVQPEGKTLVYQAKFNEDWSGDLIAYPVGSGGVGAAIWSASAKIPPPASRRMFTYAAGRGIEFKSCSDLSAEQQLVLNTNPDATDPSSAIDNRCQDRLDWLRGDTSKEKRFPNGVFRNRMKGVMGDIINSDPAYVEAVDYKYSNLPARLPEQASYAQFLADNARRTPMVYVGSNDGHLYAINGSNDATNGGTEKFTYVPAAAFDHLNRLTSPSYTHQYFVDGAITAHDAYVDGHWKTIVIAGLNGGGKGIYALDVTDPDNFDAGKVMWEFTEPPRKDPTQPPTADDPPHTLGFTFSQPQIGVLQNGKWVAVFGNGYNSESGGAYLYIVDLGTGALIKRILIEDEMSGGNFYDENNGLSTPLLYDSDNDQLIDTVYAGDLHGNLWKIDLSGDTADWGVAFSGAPLFKATDTSGKAQPITAQPKAGGLAVGGTIVVFGTGRYLADDDITDKSGQTFYGVRDNGMPVRDRNALQEQTITEKFLVESKLTVRNVSQNQVNWSAQSGWFMDLPDAGERAVSTPVIKRIIDTDGTVADRVIWVTITPTSDVCTPGGTSWLMEAQLANGGGFTKQILDTNLDGKIDDKDEIVNGERLDELGISKTPVILDNAPGFDKLLTGTTGKIQVVHNDAPPPPDGSVKRRSWIQIR